MLKLPPTSPYLHLVLSRSRDTLFSHSHPLTPSSLSAVSPLPQPLSILCLFFRNTIYPSLFTDLSVLSQYLSSQRSLQSRQCTRPATPTPPLFSPSIHWTWINSSQCSPWQRKPQSVTPAAWGITVLLWHCHIRVCHVQTHAPASTSCTHIHSL